MFVSWRKPSRNLNIKVKRKGSVNRDDRDDNESHLAINIVRDRRRPPDDCFSQQQSPTTVLAVAKRVGEIPHTTGVSDEFRQLSLLGPGREQAVPASHLAYSDASDPAVSGCAVACGAFRTSCSRLDIRRSAWHLVLRIRVAVVVPA